MDKQTVVYPYSGTLLRNEKGMISDTCLTGMDLKIMMLVSERKQIIPQRGVECIACDSIYIIA